jgi:FdhE protein
MAQVVVDVWEARRTRTSALRQRWPFAAEILDLYAALLPVQEEAFLEARSTPPAPGRIAAYVAERIAPRIAAATLEAGPPRLRAALGDRMAEGSPQAAVAGWMFGDEQPLVDRFLARASLSPVLEAMGERATAAFPGARDEHHCPRCAGPPQLSYFAAAADDLAAGGRRLVCARCHAEWGFPRMTCAGCGEQTGSRLPIYSEVGTAAGERGSVVRGLGPLGAAKDAVFPHVRIEGCETCHHYLLNVDVSIDAAAVPLVDEMAALPLYLYARDRGFTKITPNLMGF